MASQLLSILRGQVDENPPEEPENDDWTWKRTMIQPEKTGYSTITVVIGTITVLSVLSSIVATMKHWGAGWVTTFLLLGFAGILWEDLTTIPGHFLSYMVRKILSVLMLVWIAPIWYDNEDLLMIITIITIITLPLMWCVNKRLFFSDGWRYSASVQHGLTMAPNSDAEKAWKRWGCAECTALYGYAGNDPTSETIARYAKPIFILAYTKLQDKFCRDVEGNKEIKEKLLDAEERITKMKSQLAAAEQNLYELRTKEDDSGMFLQLKEDRDKMAELCAQLQLANDELVEALQNQEPIIEQVPDERFLFMTEEERVKELLARGKSCRAVEKITGVSKSKVGNIKQKMEDET